MSKIKTNRGAAKRFRKTGTRKNPGFKCASANRRHILTKKTTKRKRHLRTGIAIDQSDMGRVEQMLPNC